MLKCWEVDAKKRLCFQEIVIELSELLASDDGYVIDDVGDDGYVIDNVGANDGYLIDDPTRTPDDDYAN